MRNDHICFPSSSSGKYRDHSRRCECQKMNVSVKIKCLTSCPACHNRAQTQLVRIGYVIHCIRRCIMYTSNNSQAASPSYSPAQLNWAWSSRLCSTFSYWTNQVHETPCFFHPQAVPQLATDVNLWVRVPNVANLKKKKMRERIPALLGSAEA